MLFFQREFFSVKQVYDMAYNPSANVQSQIFMKSLGVISYAEMFRFASVTDFSISTFQREIKRENG